MRPIIEKCYVDNDQKSRKMKFLLTILFLCTTFILLLNLGQNYLNFEVGGTYHVSYFIITVTICITFGILIKKLYGVGISAKKCSEHKKYQACKSIYNQTPEVQMNLPKNWRKRADKCGQLFTNENEKSCCMFVYHLSTPTSRIGLQEWFSSANTSSLDDAISKPNRSRGFNFLVFALYSIAAYSMYTLMKLRYETDGGGDIEWLLNLTGGMIYTIVFVAITLIAIYYLMRFIRGDARPTAPDFQVTEDVLKAISSGGLSDSSGDRRPSRPNEPQAQAGLKKTN